MQFKKEEIRIRIVDAARDEFYRRGFEQASMRDIAEAAEVSVSNVYNYFTDKEDLFCEIVDTFHHDFSRLIDDLTRDASTEDFGEDSLASVIQRIGELVKRNRIDLLILLDGSQKTKYENFKDELIQVFEEHFREHMGAQTRGGDNLFVFHLIASHLIEAVLEIARHYVDDEWVDDNLNALVTYHLFGVTRLFE